MCIYMPDHDNRGQMITVLIPTKGRPDSLLRCIRSIPTKVGISIVATKPEDVPKEVINSNHVFKSIKFDDKMTVIEAMNFMAEHRSVGHVAPSSDDVEYMPGAFDKIEEMMKAWDNDVVICFKVVNMICKDEAFPVVGSPFLDRLPSLFHEEYEHFYADTDLSIIAKKQARFFVCTEAHMKNYHPGAGYPEDETHKHRRSEKLAHDEAIFNRRVLHKEI